MNVDDHRPLAGKSLRVGTIDECVDRHAVEALERDALRLDVALRIESAGLALRPAHELFLTEVPGIGVGGRFGRGEREAEQGGLRMPLQTADHAERELRRRKRFARAEIEET